MSGKYDFMDHIFTFITEASSSEELNSVLTGYFSKLISSLINYKRKDFLQYFFHKENLLESLLKHIYDKSISDLVVKILNNSETAVSTRKQSDEEEEVWTDDEELF